MAIPIRPLIVIEAIPTEVDKGQVLAVSARLFDKRTMLPIEVSRIFMTITSEKDGHIVWPLEVVRKNASGFDIMIGTEDMKSDHTYLIRVSNNWNLSPSAGTTFGVRKKTTLLPIIPLILLPFILPKDNESRKVKEYIFRTQMDHRVCPICKQYENKHFKPDDSSIPKIPLHPQCRCTMDIIYDKPEQITNEMRNAARVAVMIDQVRVPLQAVSVINSNYY